MRIQRAGCLAILGVGLAVSLAAAEPPASKAEPPSGGWFSGLFGGKPRPEKKDEPAPCPAETAADRETQRRRLENAYLRRQAVCDEIRRIALETGDAALEEEAQRLDELAMKIYAEQSSKLLGVAVTNTDDDDYDLDRPGQNAGRVLRGVAPGGAVPPYVRNGGRIEPEQSARVREGLR